MFVLARLNIVIEPSQRAKEPKMSKKSVFILFEFISKLRVHSIFSATIQCLFYSGFFSASKKDIIEEIKFGHLSILKMSISKKSTCLPPKREYQSR
jgi:hypothetical protein